LLADVKFGARMLRRSPGFTVSAIATLALAIGATTAMFAVVDGVLLKPLPVRDDRRLLVVWTSVPERGFDHWSFSYASFVGIRERLRTVTDTAAQPYAGTLPAVLRFDDGSAMPLQRTAVTGGWFDVLGVRPRAGRLLVEADDRAGAPRVAVLSSGMADRLFGSASLAIGRRLRLDEDIYTVVGVTPAAFDYPRGAEAWVAAVWFRDSPYVAWDLLVRVAPGSAREQTVADLSNALMTLPPEDGPLGPVTPRQIVHVQTLSQSIVGDARRPVLMLAAVVLLMLIVAALNVANLTNARALGRGRELSIRAAIGASRVRLVRQLAIEAAVLVSAAAIAAVFVSLVALRGMLTLAPPELPRIAEIVIDGRALLFAVAVAAFIVAFAMLPALSGAAAEPADALRSSSDRISRSRGHRGRRALVISQIATTMLVMFAAGQLLRSLNRLERLDVGFQPSDLFLAEVSLPPSRYPSPPDVQRAMVALAERVAILPGVSRATAVAAAPFAGTQGVDAVVFAEGQAIGERASPVVNYEGVDSAYFATMGVRILRGRGIDSRDRAGSAPAVVVSQTFARLFWPGIDPIGRRLKWGSSRSENPWLTVVGVAADTRYRELAIVRPTIYVPYAHGIPLSPGYLAIRGTDAAFTVNALRSAMANQEPGAVLVNVNELPRLLSAPLSRPRFQTTLAGCFAALALMLSVVGTYALVSLLVRQRRREIGIRIALGATSSTVRRLVLRQSLVMSVAGILIGVVLVLPFGRVIQPLLFGAAFVDPAVLAATAACLLLAVVGATIVPMNTAVHTDPLTVLRTE
jgi:putative ABC transport system permease protein